MLCMYNMKYSLAISIYFANDGQVYMYHLHFVLKLQYNKFFHTCVCLSSFIISVCQLLISMILCFLFYSTDLRLNQPRYATLPNIMKAKSKPIKKITPQELNVEIKSDMEIVQVTEPPKRKAGVILSSVDELVDKLKNEARVI